MVKTITKDIKGNKVPFMFGIRATETIEEKYDLAVVNFSQIFASTKIKDIVNILYACHENACFYQKVNTIYSSPDEIKVFIEEIGISEASDLYLELIRDFIGKSDESKKKKAS